MLPFCKSFFINGNGTARFFLVFLLLARCILISYRLVNFSIWRIMLAHVSSMRRGNRFSVAMNNSWQRTYLPIELQNDFEQHNQNSILNIVMKIQCVPDLVSKNVSGLYRKLKNRPRFPISTRFEDKYLRFFEAFSKKPYFSSK